MVQLQRLFESKCRYHCGLSHKITNRVEYYGDDGIITNERLTISADKPDDVEDLEKTDFSDHFLSFPEEAEEACADLSKRGKK